MMKECDKYKLDLMDYATGEMTFLTKEKQKQLFAHLRKCAGCRTAFFDYENIYALAVTEAQTKNPEFRKKMDALMERFKKSSLPAPARLPKPTRLPKRSGGQEGVGQVRLAPGENLLDHEEHIGSAAGVVWHYLGKYGKTDLTTLPKKVKLSPLNAYEAVGWLANEKKIYRSYVKQTTYGWLNEHEQSIYQEEARV